MAGSGYRVELDPRTLTALLTELRAVQPKLATGMRREVRRAGDLVKEVAQGEVLAYRAEIAGARSKSRARHFVHDTDNARQLLAASIVIRVQTSASRRQGVLVVSTGRLLPKEQQALVKALNRKDFTHPVFGRPGTQVTQTGARYFRPATLATARQLMEARIRVLMEEALAELVR